MENMRNLVTQDHPSFFQVYLPEHNAAKLAIPQAFVKNFSANIPEKVTLINAWGKAWPAKLEQVEDRLCITQGWKGYVNDHHSLEIGDFFVFKYLQDCCFHVLIFGKDGSIKQESLGEGIGTNQSARANAIPRGPTERAANVNTGKQVTVAKLQFSKTFRCKLRNYVHVPKHVVESCAVTLPQPITLRNQMGRTLKTKLRETKDRVILGYAGLKKFWRKSKIEVGNQLQFDVILGNERRIKEVIVSNTSEVLQSAYY